MLRECLEHNLLRATTTLAVTVAEWYGWDEPGCGAAINPGPLTPHQTLLDKSVLYTDALSASGKHPTLQEPQTVAAPSREDERRRTMNTQLDALAK